jgi:CubicO group peptidase (beta-lactamase class C family)
VLGEVIKKVSGQSYRNAMRSGILDPLGMDRTEPDLTAESKSWLATGYSRPVPGEVERGSFPHSSAKAYASATGFLSNVEDLAKYVSALSLDNDGLLSRESKKEMFRAHWDTGEPNVAYALGFDVIKIGGRPIVGHSGGYAGFITNVSFDPKDGFGVIVLTNANESPASLICAAIIELVDGLGDLNAYRGPDTAKTLRPYEGTYRARWADLCVSRVGSSLIAYPPLIASPLKTASTLRRKGKHSFVIDSRFNFDSTGEPVRFTVPKDANRATKMTWAANPFDRLEL